VITGPQTDFVSSARQRAISGDLQMTGATAVSAFAGHEAPMNLFIAEGHASFCIDVQAAIGTPGAERLRIDYDPDHAVPFGLHGALVLLGALYPSVVGPGENVTVLHDVQDSRIVLRAEPAHSQSDDRHDLISGASGETLGKGTSGDLSRKPPPDATNTPPLGLGVDRG
jgi:hypothetical protein